MAHLSDSWVVESVDESKEIPLPQPSPNATQYLDMMEVVTPIRRAREESSDVRPRFLEAGAANEIAADARTGDSGEDDILRSTSTGMSPQASYSKQASSSVQLRRGSNQVDKSRWQSACKNNEEGANLGSLESTDEDIPIAIDTTLKPIRSKAGKVSKSPHKSTNPSGTGRRISTRANTRATAEPDLIMPSIHEDSLVSLWVGEEKPSMRKGAIRKGSPFVRPDVAKRGEDLPSNNPAPTAQVNPDILLEYIAAFIKPILNWVYDITAGALGKLKTPISYMLAIYLLFVLLLLLRNLLTNSISTMLSPLCRIPGLSLLPLSMCYSPKFAKDGTGETPPVQFDRLMNVQSQFEAVLEESAGGVSLPLDMKRGEASIRDLRQVVRYSNLHSKNELVLEFNGFIETARIASGDLQKFNSHVGRSVDNIIATARWTKRVLDGIALRDISRGAIAAFFNDKLLAPFQPLKFTESALLDQYILHTKIVEEEIKRLVDEAQALLLVLQNLEDRLDVIHGIAVRDDLHAQSSRAEVLSQLWTKIGGNRTKLGKFNSQLSLLVQVNTYRKSAIAHVSRTIVKLQGIGTELEELRERVGSVDLLGGTNGLPLSVHIENIELGVERLETGRNRAKGIENEELRKTLGRGNSETKVIDGR